MIDAILQLDLALFELLNGAWHSPFMDAVMPFLRNKLVWIPLYIFLFVFLLVNFQKKGFIIILFAVGTVVFCDTISSKIVKPTVQRLRPCNDTNVQADVHLLINCGSGYSFTSSHATNHFGLAIFLIIMLGQIIGRWRWGLLFWAAIVSYAQIYVGVHYPLDILGGAILGSSLGLLFGTLCQKRIHFIDND